MFEGQLNKSSAGAPVAKVAKPEPMQIPANFKSLQWCDLLWNFKDVNSEMLSILHSVVRAMNWSADAGELQKDFNANSKEWLLFYDLATKVSKGMVWLKTVSYGQYEMHWCGVTECTQQNYLEVFKQLLAMVEAKKLPSDNGWKILSLTAYFNYDNELKLLEWVTKLLVSLDMRFEIVYLHKHWGTQAKVTAYPIPKPGHPQLPLSMDNTKILEQDLPFHESIKPQLEQCLNVAGLNAIFRLMSMDAINPEYQVIQLKNEFIESPQNFFVYTVEEKVKGFIQFERKVGNIVVKNCKLLADTYKFADHFIQQFLEWATKSPSYAKNVGAKEVNFVCKNSLPPALQDAIERARGNL
jgi:hypothetical protein